MAHYIRGRTSSFKTSVITCRNNTKTHTKCRLVTQTRSGEFFFLALTSSFLYQGPSVGRRQGDTFVGNAAPSATARGVTSHRHVPDLPALPLREVRVFHNPRKCAHENGNCITSRRVGRSKTNKNLLFMDQLMLTLSSFFFLYFHLGFQKLVPNI